jgi:hypothetical protein
MLKARFANFVREFLGTMKVCGREIGRSICGIAMLASRKIGSDYVYKGWVGEVTP